MEATEGLVCAYDLADGREATLLDWNGVDRPLPPDTLRWVHLDRGHARTQAWLAEAAGIDPLVCEALLAEETRPRLFRHAGGLLVILRGVNLNPGADPEDMVSVRVWIEPGRVITLRRRPLLAMSDLRERIDQGDVPEGGGALLAAIASSLTDRAGPVVNGLEEALDEVEERLLEEKGGPSTARTTLSTLRRQAVALRRYLAPQREVLNRLAGEVQPLLSERDRARLRESCDRVTRFVEDLDALRERAAVTHEELVSRMQDRMNRNMYLLSLVAAIFLPLGFLTGLLGINVGGMPGVDSPLAFWVVCAVLASIGVIEMALLYLRRWF